MTSAGPKRSKSKGAPDDPPPRPPGSEWNPWNGLGDAFTAAAQAFGNPVTVRPIHLPSVLSETFAAAMQPVTQSMPPAPAMRARRDTPQTQEQRDRMRSGGI